MRHGSFIREIALTLVLLSFSKLEAAEFKKNDLVWDITGNPGSVNEVKEDGSFVVTYADGTNEKFPRYAQHMLYSRRNLSDTKFKDQDEVYIPSLFNKTGKIIGASSQGGVMIEYFDLESKKRETWSITSEHANSIPRLNSEPSKEGFSINQIVYATYKSLGIIDKVQIVAIAPDGTLQVKRLTPPISTFTVSKDDLKKVGNITEGLTSKKGYKVGDYFNGRDNKRYTVLAVSADDSVVLGGGLGLKLYSSDEVAKLDSRQSSEAAAQGKETAHQ